MFFANNFRNEKDYTTLDLRHNKNNIFIKKINDRKPTIQNGLVIVHSNGRKVQVQEKELQKQIGEMLGHSNSIVTEHYLAGLEKKKKKKFNSVLPSRIFN